MLATIHPSKARIQHTSAFEIRAYEPYALRCLLANLGDSSSSLSDSFRLPGASLASLEESSSSSLAESSLFSLPDHLPPWLAQVDRRHLHPPRWALMGLLSRHQGTVHPVQTAKKRANASQSVPEALLAENLDLYNVVDSYHDACRIPHRRCSYDTGSYWRDNQYCRKQDIFAFLKRPAPASLPSCDDNAPRDAAKYTLYKNSCISNMGH